MNNGGDAAEQIVRLSLEGFEVAAKLSGSAAKNIALLLVSVLKQEQKTKGKARLTNMIKSGKELKVFSIPNKDLRSSRSKQNAMVFFTVFSEIKIQMEITLRLILSQELRTLPKFSVSLRDLNSVRLIRQPLLVKLKKPSLIVKLSNSTSLPNLRTKSLWRKQ